MQHIQIQKITHQATWNIRHEAMWPGKPLEFVKLPNDPEGVHFGLSVDGLLTSVVSVFINGKDAQFRKFATRPGDQRKGYGAELLKHLMEELNTLPLCKVWCNARTDKVFFYEPFGLQTTDKTFSRGDIDYVIMEKIF